MFRGWSGALGRPAAAPRRVGRCLGAAIVATSATVLIGWSAPANAHIELVDSSPQSGAEVPLTLSQIQLVFADDLFPVGNDVIVRGPDGTDVTPGEATSFGNSLAAPMALTTPGRHLVSYRVVGQDGHVIVGDLWFTAVVDGAPLPSAAAASQVDAPRDAGASTLAVVSDGTAGLTPTAWLLLATLARCLRAHDPARHEMDKGHRACAPRSRRSPSSRLARRPRVRTRHAASLASG